MSTNKEGGWFCPRCNMWLHPKYVTYEERCSECGSPVEYLNVIPTPAELAQQLADLTGNAVVVYRQPEGHWMGCIFEDTCNIHDLPFRQGGEDPDNESWCDMGAFGEFFINRPVSTTGRWQDSKVTAEPNHIGNVNEKVALKQMAERNK